MNKLKWISLYQATVCLAAIINFTLILYKDLFTDTSTVLLFIELSFVALSIFTLYTNICLLFDLNSNRIVFFIDYNILLNILHAVFIKLFGFSFFLEYGLYFLFYINFGEGSVGIHPSLFASRFAMKFSSNDSTSMFGINLVAFILLLFLINIRKKIVVDQKKSELEIL